MSISYQNKLREELSELKNPERAAKMSAYMKENFSFFGVKAPERQALLKGFIQEHGLPSKKEEYRVVLSLWEEPERELHYCALEILEKRFKKRIEKEDSVLLEFLITNKSWWDTVDLIASKLAGAYFKKFPKQIESVAEKWINSNNLWLNRSAILYQLKYKQETDPYRLFSYCIQWSHSKEFFHQKAIGWALREYSKTNPNQVVDFLKNHKVAPLSKREGLKWIRSKNIYP